MVPSTGALAVLPMTTRTVKIIEMKVESEARRVIFFRRRVSGHAWRQEVVYLL